MTLEDSIVTIRATNSTPRPVALTGTKAAAPMAEAEAPIATARDRLVLSSQATLATAESLNDEELAKIGGTSPTPASDVTSPEAKQPQTAPETKVETAKTETAAQATLVTADSLNEAELARIRGTAGATTPEATTPQARQPQVTPETKVDTANAETTTQVTKTETAKTETATEATKTETAKTEAATQVTQTETTKLGTATQATQTDSKTTQTTQSETTTPEIKKDASTSQTRGETAQKKPETQKKLLSNHVPYYSEKQHFEQIAPLIETALAGQTVSFKNSYDTSVDVTVTKGANAADGHEQYQLKVGTGSFAVSIAPYQDSKVLLAKVVEYYSRFPEHMHGEVKTISLETKQNPEDAFWIKTYDNPKFASAATAGSGGITFWNLKENPLNLSEDTFNHEMGHLVGESLKRKGPEFATRVPEGWQDAAKADSDKVSNYAGMNPDEDFAETWSYYLYSRHDDKAMEALRERVPNRVKILDALYEKAEGHPTSPAPPAAPAATAPQKSEGNGNG